MKIADVLGFDQGATWCSHHGIDPNEVPRDAEIRRVGRHAEIEVFVRDADGRLVTNGNSVVRSTVPVRLTSLDRVWLRRGGGRHRRANHATTGAALHEVAAS